MWSQPSRIKVKGASQSISFASFCLRNFLNISLPRTQNRFDVGRYLLKLCTYALYFGQCHYPSRSILTPFSGCVTNPIQYMVLLSKLFNPAHLLRRYSVLFSTAKKTHAGVVYRHRNPQNTPNYQCVEDNFETFPLVFDERFEWQYGFFRSYVKQVIYRYLDCGVLKNGFARVQCEECGHDIC